MSIEKLKAAFDAATPGEWEPSKSGTPDYAPQFTIYTEPSSKTLAIVVGDNSKANTTFITTAHNAMPALLDAVIALKMLDSDKDGDGYISEEGMDFVRATLEKLK